MSISAEVCDVPPGRASESRPLKDAEFGRGSDGWAAGDDTKARPRERMDRG